MIKDSQRWKNHAAEPFENVVSLDNETADYLYNIINFPSARFEK
jgi:hypothetical protein